MSTLNICFYGEIRKIIPKLSLMPTLSVVWTLGAWCGELGVGLFACSHQDTYLWMHLSSLANLQCLLSESLECFVPLSMLLKN